MYIEIRKNAFYLKNSQWDKEAKKTKSTSTYLGSDYPKAKIELEKLVTPESPILEELFQAQENYAYDRAILSTKKLWLEIGNTNAGLEVFKLNKKLIQAQEKYAEKLQKKSDKKSQLISDLQAQNNCDMSSLINSDNEAQNNNGNKSQLNSAENLQKLEEEGQTILPINCDDKAQKNSDEVLKCSKCQTNLQPIPRPNGTGTFLGCPNYGNH